MADLIIGRAVYLSDHGYPSRSEPRKAGRGRVECANCGAWTIEIVAGSFTTCHKCGADCSDKSDEWPEEI